MARKLRQAGTKFPCPKCFHDSFVRETRLHYKRVLRRRMCLGPRAHSFFTIEVVVKLRPRKGKE